jgi:hypothetical protein
VIGSLEGSYFCTTCHEEMEFRRSKRNRPAGLDYFRFTSIINPTTLHSYITEPAFTAVFDLALPQTPKTSTSSRPVILTNHTSRSTPHDRTLSRTHSSTPSIIHCFLFNDQWNPNQSLASPPPAATIYDTDTPRNYNDDDIAGELPSLARYLQWLQGNEGSSVVTSYHGPLDFLGSQAIFDTVFPQRKPLDPFWSDTSLILLEIRAFAARCGMYAFLRIMHGDYV